MSNYSPAHERANVATHLLGFLFGIIAAPLLVYKVWMYAPENRFLWAGALIYSLGFLMVFGFSTLYHYQNDPRRKGIMKIWDHISIYYLIAGTYTPLLIAFANPDDARSMLLILWGLAAIGTVFKLFFTGKFRLVSTLIYLAMGWMVVLAPASFREALPDEQVWWIAVGGACYTIGVLFYLVKRIPYHHAIWHVFVLGGAICHFMAVWISIQFTL